MFSRGNESRPRPSGPVPTRSEGRVTSQQERRRRKRVSYRMDVSASNGAYVGCLLDVSREGLRILCAPGFDFSRADKLRIQIPRWLDLGPSLEVRGHFIWSKAAGDEGEMEAGYVFDKLSNKVIAVLCLLIDRVEEIYGRA